ncbi:RDD family protein [Herbiconiux sp. CPCC 203407]|uniref:RDD family protein n=1 Tax=Herbiconiux oxytropis TaxID=2970915 RepID=A0AA41XHU3_9MICO|nr:RDD family protein [Herbiconiux oxytropis]MCS5720490.1 RDD family protein [Herbiconiux oxytropis]MCS5726063.1 RDD family protein [Herbiconiux oxytropis]
MTTTSGGAAPSDWPGERLGFNREGRGSVARPGRRILALLIDFAFCYVIYVAFFFENPWASSVIFLIEQVVLMATLGGGLGHLLLGMRVVRLNGAYAGWWRPIVRTVLLVLVVPAVIWDSDQRGLHDVFSGTVLVKR